MLPLNTRFMMNIKQASNRKGLYLPSALSCLLLLAALSATVKADIAGSKDHPLISRYQDSRIVGYTASDYTDYQYATGPTEPTGESRPPAETISGQLTTIIYEVGSKSDTVAQVFKNFETALTKNNLKPTFSCSNIDCGPGFAIRLFGWSKRSFNYRLLNVQNLSATDGYDFSYWTGFHSEGKKRYLVSLLVSQDYRAGGPVEVALDIVEERDPATGRVNVNLQADLANAVAVERLNDKPDVKGAQDHPLLSRYPGTFITQYTVRDFETFEYASGPRVKNQQRPPTELVDGHVTTIIYETKSVRESVQQVYQNYEDALKSANVEPIFSCAVSDCGPAFPITLFSGTERSSSYRLIDMNNQGADGNDYRYWIGKLERPTGPVFVGLYVTKRTYSDHPVEIAIDIVEPREIATGQVALNADALGDAIQATGRVVLEGLYFAQDQAVLDDKSLPALQEVASFLKQYPKASVFIVGHTDGSGSHAHNMRLSQSRANTVIETLIKGHGIEGARLTAVGVGAASPVMGNTEEAGRALNRRVEMVLAGTKPLQ